MNEKYIKLTNVVYKVLDFFPESDPLKNRAKDRALAIMDNLVLIGERFEEHSGWAQVTEGIKKEKIKTQVLEDIDILLGYLWIGKAQGWLNSANCLIIANEYEKIKKEIASIKTELTQPLNFAPKMETELVLNSISNRQQKILDYLEKNEKAQVMDLQTILSDVTKRTIRRDLDELLEMGKIIREGDFNMVFYKIKG